MKNKFYYSPELMFLSFDAKDVITASGTGDGIDGGTSSPDPDELPDLEPDE